MLYNRFSSVIYFIHSINSVCVNLNLPIPPTLPLSPFVFIHLFSTSMSLLSRRNWPHIFSSLFIGRMDSAICTELTTAQMWEHLQDRLRSHQSPVWVFLVRQLSSNGPQNPLHPVSRRMEHWRHDGCWVERGLHHVYPHSAGHISPVSTQKPKGDWKISDSHIPRKKRK